MSCAVSVQIVWVSWCVLLAIIICVAQADWDHCSSTRGHVRHLSLALHDNISASQLLKGRLFLLLATFESTLEHLVPRVGSALNPKREYWSSRLVEPGAVVDSTRFDLIDCGHWLLEGSASLHSLIAAKHAHCGPVGRRHRTMDIKPMMMKGIYSVDAIRRKREALLTSDAGAAVINVMEIINLWLFDPRCNKTPMEETSDCVQEPLIARICVRHGKIYDLLTVLCWYLCEAWQEARLVDRD